MSYKRLRAFVKIATSYIFADTFPSDFGISPHLSRRIGGDPLHGIPHQSCIKRKAVLPGRLYVIIKGTSSRRWQKPDQVSGMVPNYEDLSVGLSSL